MAILKPNISAGEIKAGRTFFGVTSTQGTVEIKPHIPVTEDTDIKAICQLSEPRFTCNTWVNDRRPAYDLVQEFTSVFRGMSYWMGGGLVTIADREDSISGIFTNANVEDGAFSYSSSGKKARYNLIKVRYINKEKDYEEDYCMVEDVESISKYGIREKEVSAFACTSYYEAMRVGLQILYSETKLTEIVTFKTSTEALSVFPGSIISIQDRNRSKLHQGGRVKSFEAHNDFGGVLKLDRPLELGNEWENGMQLFAGQVFWMHSRIPNGSQLKAISGASNNFVSIDVGPNVASYPDDYFKGTQIAFESSHLYTILSSTKESGQENQILLQLNTAPQAYLDELVSSDSFANYYDSRFTKETNRDNFSSFLVKALAVEKNVNHTYAEGDVLYTIGVGIEYERVLSDGALSEIDLEPLGQINPNFIIKVARPSDLYANKDVNNSSDVDLLKSNQSELYHAHSPFFIKPLSDVRVFELFSAISYADGPIHSSTEWIKLQYDIPFLNRNYYGPVDLDYSYQTGIGELNLRNFKIEYTDDEGGIIFDSGAIPSDNFDYDNSKISGTTNAQDYTSFTFAPLTSSFNFVTKRKFHIQAGRPFSISFESKSTESGEVELLLDDRRDLSKIKEKIWSINPRVMFKEKNWKVISISEAESNTSSWEISALEYDSSIYKILNGEELNY